MVEFIVTGNDTSEKSTLLMLCLSAANMTRTDKCMHGLGLNTTSHRRCDTCGASILTCTTWNSMAASDGEDTCPTRREFRCCQ